MLVVNNTISYFWEIIADSICICQFAMCKVMNKNIFGLKMHAVMLLIQIQYSPYKTSNCQKKKMNET